MTQDRLTSQSQPFGSVGYKYDAAGRRTRMWWNDGVFVTYGYDTVGNPTSIADDGGTPIAKFAYDDRGRRVELRRQNDHTTSYGYDAISRLTSIVHDMPGGASDVTLSFAHNPAGQLASRTTGNDAYAWTGHANQDRLETPNALNQLVQQGSTALAHDGRGNVTGIGARTFSWSSANSLVSASGGVTAYHDALERLVEYDTDVSTRFVYDGAQISAEVANPSGAYTKRYVFVPGSDELIATYVSGNASDKRWHWADERSSVIATTNLLGAPAAINRYDEWGVPASTNTGRFGYTGQAWLPKLDMWHYKARVYAPILGRFMQTDPLDYADGMNLYGYVGNDPINAIDPSGKAEIVVTGTRPQVEHRSFGTTLAGINLANSIMRGGGSGVSESVGQGVESDPVTEEIVVTCNAACRQATRDRDRAVVRVVLRAIARAFGGLATVIIDNIVGYPAADSDTPRIPPHLQNRGRDPREIPPRNAPRGTRGLDQQPRDIRDRIHRAKPGLGAGPKDWVGVTPGNVVIVTDPQTGDYEEIGLDVVVALQRLQRSTASRRRTSASSTATPSRKSWRPARTATSTNTRSSASARGACSR